MAKNTTATGSTIDGVTVVHPDNIGKGIKWNDTTKKYEVDLDVLVSSESGNRLEVRGDGLGVWETVESNLHKQYVDSVGGNDANDGSKSSPLKTFSEALRRLHASKNGGRGQANIYLKDGGTYYIGEARYGLLETILSVTNYNDAYDGDEHIDKAVYYYHLATTNKPKLVSQWLPYPYDSISGSSIGVMTTCLYLKTLRLNGIEAILEKGELTFPAGTSHFALLEEELTLRGSKLDVRSYTFVRAKTVNSGNTIHTYTNGGKLLDQFNDAFIYSGADRENYQETLASTVFTIQGSNIRSMPIDNYGLGYDVPTKRQFGWSTNWDVFANI